MTDQDALFKEFEGDRWFERNISLLQPGDDYVLYLFELYKILSPDKKVLEVGAANGYRLAQIHEKFGCKVYAMEPSAKSVKDGKRKYPYIQFSINTAKDMRFKDFFDIVIIHSVFHWIDRKNLLLSAAKIDMSLKDGGFLVIGDFQTPFPLKRKYHHLKHNEVYTYKLKYKDIFLATGLYSELSSLTINHDTKHMKGISLQNMFVISLLKKENQYIQWEKDSKKKERSYT